MHDAQQPEGVTIAEAAAHLGVSSDTVRRRIRRGDVQAMQVHTPNGPAWRVLMCGLCVCHATSNVNGWPTIRWKRYVAVGVRCANSPTGQLQPSARRRK